jgi:hypothetical protein
VLTIHSLPPQFLLAVAYMETLLTEKFGCGVKSCGDRRSGLEQLTRLGLETPGFETAQQQYPPSMWSVDNIEITAPVLVQVSKKDEGRCCHFHQLHLCHHDHFQYHRCCPLRRDYCCYHHHHHYHCRFVIIVVIFIIIVAIIIVMIIFVSIIIVVIIIVVFVIVVVIIIVVFVVIVVAIVIIVVVGFDITVSSSWSW